MNLKELYRGLFPNIQIMSYVLCLYPDPLSMQETGTVVIQAVMRIHDIFGWIRIRILDPDPAIFVIDLQDASKKLIF